MKKYFVNKKIDILLSEFNDFLYNKKFLKLVKKFDNNFLPDTNFFIYLENLYNFSNAWDYRKIQNDKIKTKSGENARWLLVSDDYVLSIKNLILEVAKELTLIGNTELNSYDFNYILVLGGARETNILRPKFTKYLIDKYDIKNVSIIGLSCDREFDITENTKKFSYPNSTKTEFDALQYGFHLAGLKTDENISAKILKAPSSNPLHRANSKDTYDYFFKTVFDLKFKSILLISSQIYTTYQSMCFMPFAITYDVDFDIVGYPYSFFDNTGNYKSAEPIKYLQEFRSTILEIRNFILRYRDEFDKIYNK